MARGVLVGWARRKRCLPVRADFRVAASTQRRAPARAPASDQRPQVEPRCPPGERRQAARAPRRVASSMPRVKGGSAAVTTPAVVDDRRGAGVGGADHRPLQLERAHARDLQVLERPRSVSPNQPMLLTLARTVGAGAARRSGPPAPRRTGPRSRCSGATRSPRDRERRRRERPAVEVAERDVHQPREPAKAGRDEFAERHQVVLVVAIEAAGQRAAAARCRPPSWCSRPGSPSGRPSSAASARRAKARQQRLARTPDRDRPAGAGSRSRARRRDRRAPRRAAPRASRAPRATRSAANFSSCGTLPCSSVTVSGRTACVKSAPAERRAPSATTAPARPGERPGARPAQRGAAEAARPAPAADRAEAVDAQPRREAGQRRVDVGVAAGDPREAGEDDAARQFGEQPDGGEKQRGAPGAAAAASARTSAIARPGRARGRPPARARRAPPAAPPGRRSGAC